VSKIKQLMSVEAVEGEVLPPQQSPLVPVEQLMAQIVQRKGGSLLWDFLGVSRVRDRTRIRVEFSNGYSRTAS